MTWQPIESAPLDGTRVLLGFAKSHGGPAEVGFYGIFHPNAAGKSQWRTTSGHRFGLHPTHWMPIPATP